MEPTYWDAFPDAPLGGRRKPPRHRRQRRKSEPSLTWQDVFHVVYGPIIVHSDDWELPPWIRTAIRVERMRRARKPKEPGMASDIEALAYLYTAGMTQPLSSPWTNIYLWVAGKELQKRGISVPEDIRVTDLSDEERVEYLKLKRWLHSQYEKIKRRRR